MDDQTSKLYQLLKELNTLIHENDRGDGTFAFDVVKAEVVLDFAKTEIQKTIKK